MRTDDVLGQKDRAQPPPKALMEAARSHLTYSRLANLTQTTKITKLDSKIGFQFGHRF